MIIKASQRGGARNLADHLTNKRDNDHIELFRIDGLAGNSVHAALLEIEAVSKGTRASQPLFSVSFNPPMGEHVTNEQFEQAFDKLANKLGLQDQPRLAIFHEKEGRRHAHVIWSRIDIDNMRAINLSHYKHKCTDISRELYREHGWQMPEGLRDREKRDAFSLSNGEWQQAKRQGVDPKEVKALIQDAWKHSDDLNSFSHALEERGLFLAKGDKRGFVAIDHCEKIYSVSRFGGIRAKDLKSRLGKPDNLPSIDQVKQKVGQTYNAEARKLIDHLKQKHRKEQKPLIAKKKLLVQIQRAERQELKDQQRVKRHIVLKSARDKFRTGIRGFFDKVTGRERRIHRINQKALNKVKRKQSGSRKVVMLRHGMERIALQKEIIALKSQQLDECKNLAKRIHQNRLRDYKSIIRKKREGLSQEFEKANIGHSFNQHQSRNFDRDSEQATISERGREKDVRARTRRLER